MMLAIPTHRRSLALLVAVVLAQILLLAIQIKRDRNMRLIRIWAVELFSPLERAGTFAIDEVTSAWFGYLDLRHARQENQQLRNELKQLRLRNDELEGSADEAKRLETLLGFRQAHADVPMLPARVIGGSPAITSRTVYINRGEKDGVRKNMALITPDGVVGKVLEVYRDTSQVLLLTDRESGVGALLADSRTQGVVKGTGAPQPEMDYVINEEKVLPGEHILTSGMDRIFPKDLPLGTVSSVQPGTPFHLIRIEPAAHLDRLEEVLILLTGQPLEPQKAVSAPAPGQPPAKPAGPPK